MDFGIGAGLDNLNTATTFANVDVSQAEREVKSSAIKLLKRLTTLNDKLILSYKR